MAQAVTVTPTASSEITQTTLSTALTAGNAVTVLVLASLSSNLVAGALLKVAQPGTSPLVTQTFRVASPASSGSAVSVSVVSVLAIYSFTTSATVNGGSVYTISGAGTYVVSTVHLTTDLCVFLPSAVTVTDDVTVKKINSDALRVVICTSSGSGETIDTIYNPMNAFPSYGGQQIALFRSITSQTPTATFNGYVEQAAPDCYQLTSDGSNWWLVSRPHRYVQWNAYAGPSGGYLFNAQITRGAISL